MVRTAGVLLAVWLSIAAIGAQRDDRQVRPPVNGDERTCEVVSVNLCRGIVLNSSLPNPRGHTTQSAAGTELNDFQGLINTNCSTVLLHFLCSFYLPTCTIFNGIIFTVRPCRSLCESVRSSCESEFDTNPNFDWPTFFNCSTDTFGDDPENFGDPACFGPDLPTMLPSSTSPPSTSPLTTTAVSTAPPTASTQCERIQISFCQNVGYNWTSQAWREQQNSLTRLETFVPVVRTRCSQAIVHFLCAFHVPECQAQQTVLQPCRDMCELVQERCLAAFQRAGISWPVNCGSLPTRSQSCSGPTDLTAVSIPLIPGITDTDEPPTSGSPVIFPSQTVVMTLSILLVSLFSLN